MNTIIKKLQKIVGAEWVRSDSLTQYFYGADVLTYFGQGALYPENHPLAVVYPASTKEVQAVVNLGKEGEGAPVCGRRRNRAAHRLHPRQEQRGHYL